MNLTVICPHCAHSFKVAEKFAGRKGRCPNPDCGRTYTVPQPPRVAVVASAIGIYGDRDDERLDEDSAYGGDFLADVARAQERASRPLAEVGTRMSGYDKLTEFIERQLSGNQK